MRLLPWSSTASIPAHEAMLLSDAQLPALSATVERFCSDSGNRRRANRLTGLLMHNVQLGLNANLQFESSILMNFQREAIELTSQVPSGRATRETKLVDPKDPIFKSFLFMLQFRLGIDSPQEPQFPHKPLKPINLAMLGLHRAIITDMSQPQPIMPSEIIEQIAHNLKDIQGIALMPAGQAIPA